MGWSGMGVYRYQGGSSRHMRSAESISSPSARSSASSLVSLAWYRTLNERAIHAFWASAIGWALDAFDFQVFSFSLTAIAATFALSQAQAGLIATATLRGGVLGGIQSAWAVGWGLSAVAYPIVFSVASPELGWRILFWLGILPALLILYVRSFVKEPEVYVETRQAKEARTREAVASGATLNPLVQIFRPDLLPTTLAASLLAIGAQGGYYAIFTWLPTFLKTDRQLSVVGTGGYTAVVIVGSFLGYIVSGYINDWLGRRPTFALYAVCSGVLIVLYTRIPEGANELLLVLGLPLGFFASGIFSGFGSYLAELYPSRARGAGQGFCYNFGRATGALFPTVIGYLSASIGLTGAIGFGAVGYALALISLLFLPETRGKHLLAVE